MDLLEKLNGPLDYIEKNLANNIDFKEVATLASCSQSYFRRMFSILVGITPSEYIRRRRLTLAAFELNNRNLRINDIALKYGYRSPDSFTRAFQDFHGVTPSEARMYERWLKSYTRMTFQLLTSKEDNHEL
ncbi:MAG: transcription activator, effector binding [Clostridia bacterium]|jgi:AraC family transcriptional regulator|nr:transcription activator, effector binding [Clostridia bacterium]